MSQKKDDESDPKHQTLDKDESSSEERRRKKKSKKKEQQKLNELKAYKSESVNPINLNSSDIRIFKDKNNSNETNDKKVKRKSRSLNNDEEIKSKRKRSKESKKRKSSKTIRHKSDKPSSAERPKSAVRILIEPQIDNIKQKRKKFEEDEEIRKKKIDNELIKKKSIDSDVKKKLADDKIKKLNELDDSNLKKKPIVDNVKKSSTDNAKTKSKENEDPKKKIKETDDTKKKSDSSFSDVGNLKRKNSYDDNGFNYLYQFDQLNMPTSKTSISNKQSLPNLKSDSIKQSPKPQNSITELKDTQSINALEQIKSKLGEQNYLKQDRPSDYEKQQQKKPKPLSKEQEKKSDNLIKIIIKEVPREQSNERPKQTPKQTSKNISTKETPKNVSKEIPSKDKLLKSEPKKITKTRSLNNLDDNKKKKNKELKKAKSDHDIPKIKIKNEKDRKEINIKATNSLKANLSLGNEIKAKVGNREEKMKGTTIKKDKNEDNDWSSISIQLDITKDPKTKKIEINEDVKVISPPKPSTGKNILSTEKLEKSDENLEIKKKELLKSKPSITHYVDKKDSIKQDTDKFTRIFTSSETDTSKSEELKRMIKKQDQTTDIIEQKQQKQEQPEKQLLKKKDQKLIQDTKTINQSLDQQEAVVLYKAESDTQNKLKDSCQRIPKRMDILQLDKKSLDKKKIQDSSSDEQTYEQIINKRNETIKLHFPAFNISPPSCKPTPPPFHLKLQDSKQEAASLDKSEELTYHEQKKKFSLRPPAKIREDNATKSIETSSSLELSAVRNELKRNKDYENIKKLDIPSEKKAELEKQQDSISDNKLEKDETKDKYEIEIKKNDSGSESMSINLKKEIKDDKKPIIELIKDEKIKKELSDKQLKRQIEVKIDKKDKQQQKISNKIKQQQTTKDEEEDELNENLRLINKFNNEIERLRRLERYLIKVKLILSDETAELEIKKSVIKRLILIKKDLNKLIKICDQLMDKKYLSKRKLSPLRRQKQNNENNRFDYSDNSNDELSSETSIGLFNKLNRLDKRKDDKFKEKKFKPRIKDDDDDKFAKSKKSKERINRKDKASRFDEDEIKDDNIDLDENRKSKGKSRKSKESIRKDENLKEQKDNMTKDNERRKRKKSTDNIQKDKKSKLKINSEIDSLSNQLISSTKFKFFLLFIIILTLIFSYCYYKRSRMPRRFPCRLKRKD